MPKKGEKLTEEQKAKMKAGREAKKAPTAPTLEDDFVPTEVQEKQAAEAAKAEAQLSEPSVLDETEDVPADANQPTHTPQPQVTVDPNLVAAVVTAVLQAQQQFGAQVAQATPDQKFEEIEGLTPKRQKARLGGGGEVQGVVFRYEVDKGYYPDPTQRLLNEPKLARFAPHENFIFRWAVDGVEYKKDNIAYAEPRFTLELFRRLYNDEGEPMRNPVTGNPVMGLVARNMLHEDEFTTRIMAMKLGILDQFEDTDEGFRALMNEIRYQRIRDWLLGIFTPAKIQTHNKRPREMNIDGKIVMVYDTEEITDHDTGVSQASTLQTQAGVGSIAVPGTD